MADFPKTTVLMPVYNGEEYLREAIESILGQTFTDFEFLIINDGSTDKSVEIIRSYQDPRIRLVENEKNLGLIASLNKGIDLARGEYIARMDCDDISLPERLEKQVAFMDACPEIGVCGSWIQVFSNENSYVQEYAGESEEIKCTAFFYSGVAHPSVIIRKDLLLKNQLSYDADYAHAEDYELWLRLFDFTKFANLPEVLVRYRIGNSQVSNLFKEDQLNAAARVREKMLRLLGISPDEDEKTIHESLAAHNFQDSEPYLEKVDAWLSKILKANNSTKRYLEPYFSDQLKMYWFQACRHAVNYGNCSWKKLTGSQLYDKHLITWKQKFGFITKSLFAGKHRKSFNT